MREEKARELADEFVRGIGKAMRSMGAIFRVEMEKRDVTWPQFHMLKFVSDRPEPTVTDISNLMMIAAPTASRMIDSLCGKGLLRKEKSGDDHRVTVVRLTEKSRRLLGELMDLQSEIVVEVFDGEDAESLEAFTTRLSGIADRWYEVAESKTRTGSE